MTADVLIENHGSVALFTPMTPRTPTNGSTSMSRSNRGSGSAVPSPANHVVWGDSLKGCRKMAWSLSRCRFVWTAPPTVKRPTNQSRTGDSQMATQEQIRDQITQQIIEALEKGGLPPGVSPGSGSERYDPPTSSAASRIVESTRLLLSLHQQRYGFQSRWYGTFKQWQDMGGRIMRRPDDVPPGEWGCGIILLAE